MLNKKLDGRSEQGHKYPKYLDIMELEGRESSPHLLEGLT